MFGQIPIPPPPACAVKEKGNLLSLPTSSNQNRQLLKEAVLSAWETHRGQDPPVLVPIPAMVEQGKLPVLLPVMAYTTKQAK